MEESVLTTYGLPAALFIIMLGMGLSLVIEDFRRVVQYPKAASIGLVNQLILLPLIGFLLAKAFSLSNAYAVGLMVLAACPGGVTSNLITHVSRGDTALSITLTAIASLITVITIPLIVGFSLQYFADTSQEIQLNIPKTIGQIVLITIIPVSIGMYIRAKNLEFAQKMERPVRIASTVILVVIIIGIILANKEDLKESFLALGAVCLALNVGTMLLGYASARLFNLNLPQSITVTIESGIQNGTLAILIAMTILKQADMALPGGVYSILMFITGGAIMAYRSRQPE